MTHVPTMMFTFLFNDTPPTEIYTLSLHDALPIFEVEGRGDNQGTLVAEKIRFSESDMRAAITSDTRVSPVEANQERMAGRSEEHTSELQSRLHLVCRLLLEKKKIKKIQNR